MVPPTDDEQQNADAAWRQLKRPEHFMSLGTERYNFHRDVRDSSR